MSRATLRIGCQDGHLDALAHMVGSAASGACLMTSRRAPGLLSQKCAFRIRILHIRSDRFARQEYAFLGEPSFWSRRVRISGDCPEHSIDCVVIFLHGYENIDNTLNSHARQPAEHRVALVASLWGQHTRGQQIRDPRPEGRVLDSESRTHDRNPEQRAFRIAAAQEISSRRAVAEPVNLLVAAHRTTRSPCETRTTTLVSSISLQLMWRMGPTRPAKPFRVESRARAGGP